MVYGGDGGGDYGDGGGNGPCDGGGGGEGLKLTLSCAAEISFSADRTDARHPSTCPAC
jgi:hypothetical protein